MHGHYRIERDPLPADHDERHDRESDDDRPRTFTAWWIADFWKPGERRKQLIAAGVGLPELLDRLADRIIDDK